MKIIYYIDVHMVDKLYNYGPQIDGDRAMHL